MPQDILDNASLPPLQGILHAWYCFKEDIAAWPSYRKSDNTYFNTFTMVGGKVFVKIESDFNNFQYQEVTKIDGNGSYKENLLLGLTIGNFKAQTNNYQAILNKQIIVIFEHMNGDLRIMGSVNHGARLVVNTDTETVGGGIPGDNYKIAFQSPKPSAFFGNSVEVTLPVADEFLTQSLDRWGLQLPSKLVTAIDSILNWNTYDFTDMALDREAGWGGFDTDLQDAADALIVANLYKKLIAWFPNVGGSAGCHRWNFKYPFDDNRAHRMLFSGLSHSSLGLAGFSGFAWAFPNVNVQSFTNTYDFAIGIVLTSDLGTSLGVTKNIFTAQELTGGSAGLSINTTTGDVTYMLFNGSATYVPGAPEADYTGFRYVVKRQGTNLKLFINGVLVQTTTPTFNLSSSSYTINSTIRFGGQGSGNLALESTLGNIYMASDLSDANVITIDGIINTLETAVGR